jgi:hypothetical protein
LGALTVMSPSSTPHHASTRRNALFNTVPGPLAILRVAGIYLPRFALHCTSIMQAVSKFTTRAAAHAAERSVLAARTTSVRSAASVVRKWRFLSSRPCICTPFVGKALYPLYSVVSERWRVA